jgi:hypothetical protein
MRRTFLVVTFGAALTACGGGDSGPQFVNPDTVQFTYNDLGAAAGSNLDAALAGQGGAADALGLTDAADDSASQSLANLPDSMAGQVFDATLPAVVAVKAAQARDLVSSRAAAYAAGNLAAVSSGFDDPGCVTITLTQVTYAHCTVTESDTGSTATIDVNGSLSRSLTGVDWDVAVAMDMTVYDTGGDVTVGVRSHLTGEIGVSDVSADVRNVAGFARSDNSAWAAGQGQSISMAFTHNVDLDLDYNIDCVVGGSLELKRIWAERPQGATAADLPNVGILFEWSGCGLVNVSVSWEVS